MPDLYVSAWAAAGKAAARAERELVLSPTWSLYGARSYLCALGNRLLEEHLAPYCEKYGRKFDGGAFDGWRPRVKTSKYADDSVVRDALTQLLEMQFDAVALPFKSYVPPYLPTLRASDARLPTLATRLSEMRGPLQIQYNAETYTVEPDAVQMAVYVTPHTYDPAVYTLAELCVLNPGLDKYLWETDRSSFRP